MLSLPVATGLGTDEQQLSTQPVMRPNSQPSERRLPHTEFAHYDTFEPFDLDDDQYSRPSTAQSSRSQTPDNTDVDDSTTLLDQLGKVSLNDHVAPPGLAGPDWRMQTRRLHINDLPIDVMHEILHYLHKPSDLLSFMRVQRRWFGLAVPRLWFRPTASKTDNFDAFCSVLSTPPTEQMHPYAQHVSRVNFSTIGREVTDQHVLSLAHCVNMKRFMLSRCRRVSSGAVERAVVNMPDLWMLDVDEVPIDDAFLAALSRSCQDLQVFYADSDNITDAGLAELARLGKSLRRLRLKGCNRVTSKGVLNLALASPNLVELDLAELACFNGEKALDGVIGFMDSDIQRILLNCEPLRILKICGSPFMTDSVLNLRGLRPLPRVSNLRELHLSCSPLITDAGVLQITQAAPKLRLLNLSRCIQVTDRSLEYIACAYGPNLEYLHIGHCMNISDRGVIAITQHCHRLWYFDAANCANLTDHAILHLTQLRNLKRIGIVKCVNITDQSVLAISLGLPDVERLHLSYCTSITQYSITRLLERCHNIVHLSLTGVHAFMDEEIRSMGRIPPEDLSDHQRQMFCVFSQSGVSQLRTYLLEMEKSLTAGPDESRRRMLSRLNVTETPIDQLGPNQLRDIAWLRQHDVTANVYDQLDEEPEHVWTNPRMLPVRDGLIRFGPRAPHDIEHSTELPFEFFYDLGPNERVMRLNRPLAAQAPGITDTESEQNEVTPNAPPQTSESQNNSQNDSDEAEATPVVELRERRFRYRFQSQSAPTGPLEGTDLPPQ